MGYRNSLSVSVAFGALMAAQAAHADLTADQVWETWKTYYESLDQIIEVGSETRSGNVLTLSDMVLSTDLPDGGDATLTIAKMVLTEQTDGTVVIVMSEALPMALAFPEMDDGDKLIITIGQPGMRTVASEIEGGVRYDFEAEEVTIRLTELVAEGQAIDAVFDFGMETVSGRYDILSAGVGGIASSLVASALTVVIDFENPEDDEEAFALDLSMTGLALGFDSMGIDLFDGEDIGAALAAGFSFDLSTAYRTASAAFNFRDGRESFEGTGSATDGATRIALNPESAIYRTGVSNVAISMAGAEIPFPSLDISYDQLAVEMAVPLVPGDGPADINANLRLVNLAVNDEVWAMADPMGAFPHDPVSVVVDLDGKIDLAGAIYDDEMMFMMMMAGPLALGELTEVRLNELRIEAVGAELMGEGQVALDYTDLETYGGIPKPVGSITLMLRGGNALLDTLVSMGIVPRDEAQGMRMMLGLFTRPVDGDADHLTTTLEAREDGSVYANGQRIQ